MNNSWLRSIGCWSVFRWFDIGCVLLRDPSRNIELQVFTQATPVPNQYVSAAQDQTPVDYNLRWSGLAVTVGQAIQQQLPQVDHSDWHRIFAGVSRRELIYLAAKSLATMYRLQTHVWGKTVWWKNPSGGNSHGHPGSCAAGLEASKWDGWFRLAEILCVFFCKVWITGTKILCYGVWTIQGCYDSWKVMELHFEKFRVCINRCFQKNVEWNVTKPENSWVIDSHGKFVYRNLYNNFLNISSIKQ